MPRPSRRIRGGNELGMDRLCRVVVDVLRVRVTCTLAENDVAGAPLQGSGESRVENRPGYRTADPYPAPVRSDMTQGLSSGSTRRRATASSPAPTGRTSSCTTPRSTATGFRRLEENQHVEFEVAQGPKGRPGHPRPRPPEPRAGQACQGIDSQAQARHLLVPGPRHVRRDGTAGHAQDYQAPAVPRPGSSPGIPLGPAGVGRRVCRPDGNLAACPGRGRCAPSGLLEGLLPRARGF